MGDQPQQSRQGALRPRRKVTAVRAAARVADVIPRAPVGQELLGPAQHRRQAALGGQDVEATVAAPGAGAALVGEAPGGAALGTGPALVLQGAVVA